MQMSCKLQWGAHFVLLLFWDQPDSEQLLFVEQPDGIEVKIAMHISKYYKCLKISCFKKIYKKEASELKACRARLSRIFLFICLQRNLKLYAWQCACSASEGVCASQRSVTSRSAEPRVEKMSLKGLALSLIFSSLRSSSIGSCSQLRLWEEVVKWYKFRLSC